MTIQAIHGAFTIGHAHQRSPLREARQHSRLHFRYIAMRGSESLERQAWIDQLPASYGAMDFGSSPEILTSRAEPTFDFVVFGGEDAARLAKFMRAYGTMLHDKPKLCVCMRSHPGQRAVLLMAGFDDVADVRRASPEEFMARVTAIQRRYGRARVLRQQFTNEYARLDQICQVSKLSARQRQIVLSLLNAPGAILTRHALLRAARGEHDDMSAESLKTMISMIRKHLRPGYAIVAQVPAMYRLLSARSTHRASEQARD